jgi:hypothetical protein
MALSNREKQQRWRERHIVRRREVQRIASLLLRRTWRDEHFEELGGLLQSMMNHTAIAALRRALKPRTSEEMAAINRASDKANEDAMQRLWLQEHPGRTAKDYRRQSGDSDSEVWQWRRARGAAINEAEQQAWEADHPGRKFADHCGLSDREATDLERWRRKYAAAKGRNARSSHNP